MRDGAERCAIDLHWLLTSGVFGRNYQSGIMGYGAIAEAKNLATIYSAVMRHMKEATSLKSPTGKECLSD